MLLHLAVRNVFTYFFKKRCMGKDKDEKMEKLVGSQINRYKLTKYISSGGYGSVFEVSTKNNKKFATKIPIDTESGYKSIDLEYKIYKKLNSRDDSRDNGIMSVKLSKYNDHYLMVMDLLGPSLHSLLANYKTFHTKTIILVTIQSLKILKYIHSHGYIHRDIKSCNFVIDRSNPDKIYCIDLGMALKYIDKNGNHLDQTVTSTFYGTEVYASISSHNYKSQSRRDDLESLFYMLVTLFKGKLPWHNLKITDKKERIKKIGEMKKEITAEVLCKGLPKEFTLFYKYICNLEYYDKPHYTTLIRMFSKSYVLSDFTGTSMQWTIDKSKVIKGILQH